MMFADGTGKLRATKLGWTGSLADGTYYIQQWCPEPAGFQWEEPWTYSFDYLTHNDKVNFAFVDGHVVSAGKNKSSEFLYYYRFE